MKKIGLLALSTLFIAISSCKKEEIPVTENNKPATSLVTPSVVPLTNYIKKGSTYYELKRGKILAGLYDGGPKFFIAIFLSDSNVTFVEDDNDVNAFSGIGNGNFIHILTTDSLESGNFSINQGWVGFKQFNFNNPSDSIYNLNSLPSNFLYLDNQNVSFLNSGNSKYQISIVNNDFEIKYSGVLDWIK